MECPTCRGTGHERPYEPWEDCQDCDGAGTIWADDDDCDDRSWEENLYLYTVPIG